MFSSIIDDIKMQFRTGNMLTRIILINVFVFMAINILIALTGHLNPTVQSSSHPFIKWLAVPSGFIDLLKKPWTLFTHMFLHVGFMHIIWNMLFLYWFGKIVGDFYGDKRLLPLYILGGLTGVAVYLIADHLLPIGTDGHSMALGASASIMAFVFIAAVTSPDYEFNLLILGRIKIKYIAAFFLFMDLLRTTGDNSGGHFGHIGGALFGFIFVSQIRNGNDLTEPVQGFISWLKGEHAPSTPKRKRSPIKVVHRNEGNQKGQHKSDQPTADFQSKLDSILEKISKEGMENLTNEERAFLDAASKRD